MKRTTPLLMINLLLLPKLAIATDDMMIESFDILPSICVVVREQSCQQNIQFQWRLSQPGNSCLFQAGQAEPLHCSEQQQTSLVLALKVAKENEFILRLTDASARVMRRQLIIRELGKDVRQSRRHLWSVF